MLASKEIFDKPNAEKPIIIKDKISKITKFKKISITLLTNKDTTIPLNTKNKKKG